MRYDTGHKARTRHRMVEAAGRHLKRQGIDGSGVAALMSEAGLTNGAFYAHFDSKADLVAAALTDQLDTQRTAIENIEATLEGIDAYIVDYLSPHRRDDRAGGCPSAALVGEIVHADDAVRGAYTAGIRSIQDAVARLLPTDDTTEAHRVARGLLAVLIGTLQMARAVDDADLSAQLLADGVENARTMLASLRE